MRRMLFIYLLVCCSPAVLYAQIRFTDQAPIAGVADGGEANGAAFGDYSGDGLPDLFVARLGEGVQPLLYLNQGDGTFANERAMVAGIESTMGGIFVDYDADGDLDLYTVHFFEPNRLLENEGGRLAVVDGAEVSGDQLSSTTAAFADFDGDGLVDLYTGSRFRSPNQYYTRIAEDGFIERSESHSALRSGQESFGAVPFDYDADGDQDLYVSSLGFANLLYRNERGTYRQVARETGLIDEGASVAALPADYDNDGDLDVFMVRARGGLNSLYANDGGYFSEVSAGVEGTISSTGAVWADFDNDGDLDLLVSNIGATALYENTADGHFDAIAGTALPPLTQSAELVTAGVVAADYDADGDVDVFVSGLGTADLLLRNDSASARWLRVELMGRPGRTTLGSRVRVLGVDGIQLREQRAATQIGNAHGGLLHFGVGAQERVDVEITWASGQRQFIDDVDSEQVLRVQEPLLDRDLRIDTVVEPGLAPQWRPLSFVVEVRNAGAQEVVEARLIGRVEVRDEVHYEESLVVPPLAAGESVRLRFPTWTPEFGGAHRFSFQVQVDDAVAANNNWERVHVLHRFNDVAPQLGVADPGPGFAGAWSDFDRDGDIDLYLSNGGSSGDGVNALYRNDGDAGFAEIAEMSGVADVSNSTGVVFADFDRDGWQDLFVSKGGFTRNGEANRFFHNEGDGSFADVSETAGFDEVQSSYTAVVGDYDLDGYIDLYVAQFRGQPNHLYHNDGEGGFEEVGPEKGIVSLFNFSGSAAAFADYDGDGDTDLYASMFGTFDVFYAETGAASFSAAQVGDEGSAVGIANGDYDNDGDLDVYIVNQGLRSVLRRNDVETVTFADVGGESGTENLTPGAGCAFGDFDSDGDLDLFVVNGFAPDRVFMNQGNGTFVDMAVAYGMADTSQAWAVLVGDYDSDGDLDPYVINEGSANRLYQNNNADYNWLQVGVRGIQSNVDGIGTRVQLFADGRTLMRDVNGTAGMSQSSRVLHFGLGRSQHVDSLWVRWPNGQMDHFLDLPANSRLEVVEGEGAVTVVAEAEGGLPTAFVLEANFPNPFNAETKIRYGIEVRGVVVMAVYNTLGQRVRVLFDAEQEAGRYKAEWDARDDRGRAVGSGVYFYRLQSGGRVLTQSMVLLR